MIQSELDHVRSAPNLMRAILHWAETTPAEPALRFHRDGEWHDLTVTLKLKRRVVAERHREAIEGLYREGVRSEE